MKKFLKSSDNRLYLNVTEYADRLWQHVDLFVLWEKGTTTYRLTITDKDELSFALGQPDKAVCIELGRMDELSHLFNTNNLKWEKADTLTHNGYIYVKYNDLFD